ncbi:MAG: ChaN family lipoprotein [Pseudomonadota bacterium]
MRHPLAIRRTALRAGSALLTPVLSAMLVAGCAALPDTEPAVLLLGEQHDAADHHRRHLETVQRLAAHGRLAALAMEMAEQGASTTGLAADASEAAVRASLRWNEAAWPWAAYGPVVMAAVRVGVPVLGANLPRERMRAVMADAALDQALPEDALARQRAAIRDGHCGLLPEGQIVPMTRIQVARDRAMADTLAGAARPGKTVVLVAGSGHVDPALGVPRHLPSTLAVRQVRWPAPEGPGKDYCGELRRQLGPRG